ncbi:unnamed protein product [Caenorhabditis auriculariae]|uniref:Uncharacterized protein n=1 Tax=Caenorhabditis auriculariae TaxID=2777116 RepID=A0A8S1H0T8_9PELO|nr:unnamed protein product [Caenorhabditis auriculariae]
MLFLRLLLHCRPADAGRPCFALHWKAPPFRGPLGERCCAKQARNFRLVLASLGRFSRRCFALRHFFNGMSTLLVAAIILLPPLLFFCLSVCLTRRLGRTVDWSATTQINKLRLVYLT